MTTLQKIKRLKKITEQAITQQTKPFPDAAFDAWRINTEGSLSEVFGTDSFQVREFQKLKFKYNRGVYFLGQDYSHSDREQTKRAYARDLKIAIGTFQGYLENFLSEQEEQEKGESEQPLLSIPASNLSHLHPTVQQAASSRFASTHYSDAVEKACIALEKAVRDKANQPVDLAGTDLLNRVFSQASPLLTLSADRGEREGYMFLFRGMWQALRNHHAHNDTTTDPARALEWLSFISALFYKLDDTLPSAAPLAP